MAQEKHSVATWATDFPGEAQPSSGNAAEGVAEWLALNTPLGS
jgi:hypothetical protein